MNIQNEIRYTNIIHQYNYHEINTSKLYSKMEYVYNNSRRNSSTRETCSRPKIMEIYNQSIYYIVYRMKKRKKSLENFICITKIFTISPSKLPYHIKISFCVLIIF